jgi:hypothetical protein
MSFLMVHSCAEIGAFLIAKSGALLFTDYTGNIT